MRLLPITALLTLALAAPAAATPVLTAPLKPCYASDGEANTDRETVHLRATGFTPAAHLILKLDGAVVDDTGRADVSGAMAADIPAPFQGIGQRPFTIVVQEVENPANVLSATALVTNLSVTLRPKRARPSRKVRFSGRGFTADKPVYGHYLFGGKVRKTVRLARQPVQPCGIFHSKRRQIPVRRPAVGDWILQVDQQRRYSPHPTSNLQLVYIHVAQTVKTP